ncbi:hypothetical protein L2735_18140 [Shewanella olleyana]|uniref:hypothetical protein n=1 Tax=Shewanella olleyana TaxID=135626 RepID=UPI00200C8178|nr:hypothetical protein [Shewanella olleyana]MCL1068693.1 hypothetical protein [Shewanella olleyana]
MKKFQVEKLKKAYKGKQEFQAKNAGYNFNFLTDKWVLGYKSNLYLGWMNYLDIEEAVFIELRLAIAKAAKYFAVNSLNAYCSTLKSIVKYLTVRDFNAWWITLGDTYKIQVRETLYALSGMKKDYCSSTLKLLYESVANETLKRNNGSKFVLDSMKGAYSEVELDNILESLRISTTQALNKEILITPDFTALRTIIASQLMVAIVRRPTQLSQIKWCDVLPVGQEFKSHKNKDCNWQPINQHLFSDVEQLHIRTFMGKDGMFRYNVEPSSHRLEPDLSILLLQYYQVYEQFLKKKIFATGIDINADEMKELMKRLPLHPDQSLFSAQFRSKEELFNSVSETSIAYHQSSDAMQTCIAYLFKKNKVKSDRHPTTGVILANNRWRHTQLTQAVSHGFSPAQIASITGVTIEAIEPYLDLKAKERILIDKAYAGNQIIKKFDSMSVKELKTNKEYSVKNEFEAEIGYKLNPSNCSSCQSKGGAPMACYPCDNFRPLETANHQQYLDKARRKLEINSQSGHPATVRKLRKIITYIEATITVCNENLSKKLERKP